MVGISAAGVIVMILDVPHMSMSDAMMLERRGGEELGGEGKAEGHKAAMELS
jgi:hypothetical protein